MYSGKWLKLWGTILQGSIYFLVNLQATHKWKLWYIFVYIFHILNRFYELTCYWIIIVVNDYIDHCFHPVCPSVFYLNKQRRDMQEFCFTFVVIFSLPLSILKCSFHLNGWIFSPPSDTIKTQSVIWNKQCPPCISVTFICNCSLQDALSFTFLSINRDL